MQCSADQIEAKRKLAQQKLAEKLKNKSPVKPLNLQNVAVNYNSSPIKSKPEESTYFKAKSTNSFYGENNKPNKTTPQTNGTNSTAPFYGENSKQNNLGPQMNTFQKHTYKPYDKQRMMDRQKTDILFQPNVVTGKLSLISKTWFQVELSGFSSQAFEVFKSIPAGKFYDPKTKIWSFEIRMYEVLQRKMISLLPAVSIGKLPQFVLNCVKNQNDKESKVYDLSHIDSELSSALMPFQEEGVCFGIDKDGRCLIADDMGLGKTFQALAIADYYKDDWPILIVTTSTMKNVWEGTIHKYMVTVPIMQVQHMVGSKDFTDYAQILIISHELLARCGDKLATRNFGIIIIDESHTLKNPKAKCTQVASTLTKRAKRVILLSGTPALSRPSELYTQLCLIDDKFFGNYFDYSKRYCNGHKTHFGWDASGQSNLQELEILLGLKFMIRRTKEDVLKTLPNKTQVVVDLDVNLAQFSEADRKCLLALSAKYNVEKKHMHLLTFFQETAKIKIPSVCSYILQVLESNKKFLVFAHHRKMLDAIQQVLEKKKRKFIRIDGDTSVHRRKYLVDKFQLDDNYVCAILSITAANAGITLTAAQLVLFAELHWNPSILSQAEARAHRIGQEGHVVIQYLLAHGTSDDAIWIKLKEKQKILKDIGLMRDSFQEVSIKKQEKRLGNIAEDCLNTSITSANTLDITSYFTSPKKEASQVNSSPVKNIKDSEMDIQNCDNFSREQIEFLFDDEMDDVLSNINLDI